MSSLTYGAPLLAFGPPGWVAYAVLGVVTTGAVIGAAVLMSSNDAADKDLSSSPPADACSTCEPPNRRHDPCKTKKNDPTKDKNSMVDPRVRDQVNKEVASIKNGQVPKKGDTWTINGRTYGRHNNSLHPISGDGIVNFSRMQHQFIKQLNGASFDDAMKFADALKSKNLLTQAEIDQVLEIWKRC